MRNSVINLIHEYARSNKDVYFLTADLGYSVIDDFHKEFPERCINVGISEQNMIGLAAGLALAGKKVFAYSIVPFATMRCFEQIRVDVCYQNLDVTIIGVGGGFAYGTLGPTHHAIEDVAIMRSLPNMKVVVPADPSEAVELTKQIFELGGPTYIRLNRGGESDILENKEDYNEVKFGKAHEIKTGVDVFIISMSDITHLAVEASEKFKEENIIVGVASMHTVKPIDKEFIKRVANEVKIIVSLEEHNVIGGLGSVVSEILAEENINIKFKRLGVNDEYSKFVGKQDYLREKHGLSTNFIVNSIKEML